MRRIHAVLFDLDDTLISWEGAGGYWAEFRRDRTAGVHAHLTARGAALPDHDAFHAHVSEHFLDAWSTAKLDHVAPRVDRALLRALDALGVETGALDAEALLAAYGWEPVPGVRPFDGAAELLAGLRARGYQVGLVTNSMEPMWMRDVELVAYGLLEHFDVRLSASDVGFIKPHPAIFGAALEQLEREPEEVVFVGDRLANDVAGAQAMGMVSVLMRPPHIATREDHLARDIMPDYTITRLSELDAVLERFGRPEPIAAARPRA